MMLRRHDRRLLRADGGVASVEFAIVFPAFFLLLFGIFDFARACWMANSLQFAVAQGARYVMMNPTGNGKPTGANCASWTASTYQTNIQNYMQTQLSNANVYSATPAATASVSCNASPPTLSVTVTASYTFTFVLSDLIGLFPGGFGMQQQAVVTTPLS